MEQDKSPAAQVKEAAWKYTAQGLTLLVVFGAGVFLGFQLWGAGDAGARHLRERLPQLELELNRIKNEREDAQKKFEVTEARRAQLEKELNALKAKAAGQ